MSLRIHNDTALKEVRKKLRTQATPQECMLWSRIKGMQLGARFRRQHSVGQYVLDFYCPSLKIAVEIDGSQHIDRAEYDAVRTEYLKTLSIRVLRFGNNEVNANMDGVLLAIRETIQDATLPQSFT